MSLLKLVFNILLIYGLWQLIKVAFTINTARKEFRRGMEQMQQQRYESGQNSPRTKHNSTLDTEGEYVDFEEMK